MARRQPCVQAQLQANTSGLRLQVVPLGRLGPPQRLPKLQATQHSRNYSEFPANSSCCASFMQGRMLMAQAPGQLPCLGRPQKLRVAVTQGRHHELERAIGITFAMQTPSSALHSQSLAAEVPSLHALPGSRLIVAASRAPPVHEARVQGDGSHCGRRV